MSEKPTPEIEGSAEKLFSELNINTQALANILTLLKTVGIRAAKIPFQKGGPSK